MITFDRIMQDLKGIIVYPYSFIHGSWADLVVLQEIATERAMDEIKKNESHNAEMNMENMDEKALLDKIKFMQENMEE